MRESTRKRKPLGRFSIELKHKHILVTTKKNYYNRAPSRREEGLTKIGVKKRRRRKRKKKPFLVKRDGGTI